MEEIPIYLLAGGRSSRFGSDKARALVGGVPLIVAVARSLGEPARISVVAREPGSYGDLGLRTIADAKPDLGPLGGLEAALADRGQGWLVLAACDTLGLRAEWLDLLFAARGAHRAAAFRGQHWEPMPALYHTALEASVRVRLGAEARARSLHALLDEHAAALPLPAGWSRLRAVNTRADLDG
jgi:molybdopterin-guanine dinucleotide biosynthesis protein A